MPVPENISSKNETDYQRDGVITPDRLHYSDSDSDDDDSMIPEQSEMIFKQFLAQRFAEENLSNVQPFPQQPQQNYYNYQLHMPPSSGQGLGYSLSDELTRDMSNLAETFRRSGGRQEVTEQVANIDLGTLSKENLSLMLSQLFEDGVTPARLLVLFYFCYLRVEDHGQGPLADERRARGQVLRGHGAQARQVAYDAHRTPRRP